MVNVKVISPANLGTEFTQVAPKIGLNLDASLVKAATGQIGLNRSVGIKRASQQASGTTLVNDAQLFLTMTPGYWLTDVFLKYTAGGRNDLKFDFNVESGAMAGTWQVDRSDNGTGNSTSAAIQLTSYALNNVFVAGGNGAVQNLVMMRGVIQVTTAGVLRFRFARETSTPPCKERIIVREHMSIEGFLAASLMTLFGVLFGALIYAYVSAVPINRPYPTYTPMATPIPATPTATATLTSTPTATPTNTPSPSPTRARQYLYAVKARLPLLNVRTCGNLACSIINSVPMGTVLFVLEESNGWLRVGEAAWVCVDYTQRLGEKHD